MIINESNKPKHASDKYRVINFIIVHTQVQKKDVTEMRYTRTYIRDNDGNSQHPNFILHVLEPFQGRMWTHHQSDSATCNADHRGSRDMSGIRVAVRRSLAEQMKLPHSNNSSYLNRNVSINNAH